MSLDKIPHYSTYRAKFEGASSGSSKKGLSKRGVESGDEAKQKLANVKKSLLKRVESPHKNIKKIKNWRIDYVMVAPEESTSKFESLCVRCQLSTNLSQWKFNHCKQFLQKGLGGSWYKLLHHFREIRPIMDKMTAFRLHAIETALQTIKQAYPDVKWIRLGDLSDDPGLPIALVLDTAELQEEKVVKECYDKLVELVGGSPYSTVDVHLYGKAGLKAMEDALKAMEEMDKSFYHALLPGHSRKDLIAKVDTIAGMIISKGKPVKVRKKMMERLLAVIDKNSPQWRVNGTPVLFEATEKLYSIAGSIEIEESFQKDAIGGLIQLCYRNEDPVITADAARRLYHLTKPDNIQDPKRLNTMALRGLIQLAKQRECPAAQGLAIHELSLIISNEEGKFPEFFRKDSKQVISDLIDGLKQDNETLENTIAKNLSYIAKYGGELASYWAKTKHTRVHEQVTNTVSHFG